MSSNKRVKIYLSKNEMLLNFMWADVQRDGSVMMGIYGPSFKTTIEKIIDATGISEPIKHFNDLDSEKIHNNTKISF